MVRHLISEGYITKPHMNRNINAKYIKTYDYKSCTIVMCTYNIINHFFYLQLQILQHLIFIICHSYYIRKCNRVYTALNFIEKLHYSAPQFHALYFYCVVDAQFKYCLFYYIKCLYHSDSYLNYICH